MKVSEGSLCKLTAGCKEKRAPIQHLKGKLQLGILDMYMPPLTPWVCWGGIQHRITAMPPFMVGDRRILSCCSCCACRALGKMARYRRL